MNYCKENLNLENTIVKGKCMTLLEGKNDVPDSLHKSLAFSEADISLMSNNDNTGLWEISSRSNDLYFMDC